MSSLPFELDATCGFGARAPLRWREQRDRQTDRQSASFMLALKTWGQLLLAGRGYSDIQTLRRSGAKLTFSLLTHVL